jgi:hypothetical protein
MLSETQREVLRRLAAGDRLFHFRVCDEAYCAWGGFDGDASVSDVCALRRARLIDAEPKRRNQSDIEDNIREVSITDAGRAALGVQGE